MGEGRMPAASLPRRVMPQPCVEAELDLFDRRSELRPVLRRINRIGLHDFQGRNPPCRHVSHKSLQCFAGCWRQAQWLAEGGGGAQIAKPLLNRSEEHTSELQSLMRISYAVFCLKKKIMY